MDFGERLKSILDLRDMFFPDTDLGGMLAET